MTYGGNPSTDNTDYVRFLLQDTSNDSAKEYLTDTEIDAILTLETSVKLAAAICAEAIAAKFGQILDHSVLSTSVSANPRAQFYLDLAAKLRDGASTRCTILVGGRTISEKEDFEDDTTLIQPMFRRGMDDLNSGQESDFVDEQ